MHGVGINYGTAFYNISFRSAAFHSTSFCSTAFYYTSFCGAIVVSVAFTLLYTLETL